MRTTPESWAKIFVLSFVCYLISTGLGSAQSPEQMCRAIEDQQQQQSCLAKIKAAATTQSSQEPPATNCDSYAANDF
jgi:hypothetical protein